MTARLAGAAVLVAGTCGTYAPLACANTAPASATGQMGSLLLSMLLIVALIVGAAWLLKRMAPHHYARSELLRVVAGAAVGQRERVVIVEIGATWLVVGVAPGQVSVLHQLPRVETPPVDTLPGKPRSFAQWLTALKNK